MEWRIYQLEIRASVRRIDFKQALGAEIGSRACHGADRTGLEEKEVA
jgi:hypothetical protein